MAGAIALNYFCHALLEGDGISIRTSREVEVRQRRVENRCAVGELIFVANEPAQDGLVSCVGVMRHEAGQPLLALPSEEPGAVEWMETGCREFGGIPDVVEIGGRDQKFSVAVGKG